MVGGHMAVVGGHLGYSRGTDCWVPGGPCCYRGAQ